MSLLHPTDLRLSMVAVNETTLLAILGLAAFMVLLQAIL